MDPLMVVYHRQKTNVDLLRRRLNFPIEHGFNLPSVVDLRPWMTAIEDQGDMGSCVANAIAGALEYLYRRYTGKIIDVSRLFIDYNGRATHRRRAAQIRELLNEQDTDDSFDTNRNAAMQGLQQYGFCAESLWPYDADYYMQRPPKEVYSEAMRRSVVPLKIPINIISVKTCLAHKIPVLVGIELSGDEAYNNRGWVKVPETPPNEGIHACLVVGYDDRNRHFIIRNSWGRDWGDEGYCYVPYQYLIDKRLVATADAFWAIAQIVPRRMMRQGYYNYPNFTQYHQQIMLPLTDKTHREQHSKHRHRRRRHYYQ